MLAPLPLRQIVFRLTLGDIAFLAAGVFAGRLLSENFRSSPFGSSLAFFLFPLATLGIFALCGLYSPRVVGWGWKQVSRLIRAMAFSLAAVLGVFAVTGHGAWAEACLWWVGGIVGAGVFRGVFMTPWLRARFGDSIRGARVIVGVGHLARRVAGAAAADSGLHPKLVGFVDDFDETPYRKEALKDLSAPFLGGLDRVREMAAEGRISHVLVAREDLSRGRLVELAHEWMEENLHVSLVSSAFEVMVARASASMMGGVPLADLRPSPQRGWRLTWKRIVDITLSILGGIVLLPLLASIALAIKLTSRGPVLYKQKRVGRNGKEFTFFKFRSMYPDNDDRAHRKYVEALMRGEPAGVNPRGEKVYKMVNDPRITPVGRFLRATSLDEFPQLWNVIRGDMSLVGPRPCLPYEWELYEDWQRPRLDVLPGITGLWQVSGRSQVPFEEMVLLDLHYIANWSLSLDMALLFKTVPVVINGSGGH